MSFIRDNFLGGNERDAARAQVAAGDRALEFQREALDTARGDLQPFRDAGGDVLDPLLASILAPDSDFERTEGFRAIQNSAAAGGKLQSGGTLKALTEFNTGLNERNRSRRTAELFNLATLGANAAAGQATATQQTGSNLGNIAIGQGNAIAGGKVGSGNAVRGTIFDIGRIATGLG